MRLTVALFSALMACGCAAPQQNTNPNAVQLTRTEYARLHQAAARVGDLETQLAGVRTRLKHIEQRVGLASLQGTRLKTLRLGGSLSLGKASFIGEDGGRARKRDMGQYLQQFNGFVVTYWATWCKPCISDEELVSLRQLQKQLRRHNIELVSIAVDDLSKVQRHRKARRWLYPFWHRNDAHLEMLPRSLINQVGVGLPLFLVVSRDGQIRYFYNRKLDEAAIRDMVSATASACRI